MLKVGLIGLGFMGATHNACYSVLSQGGDVKVTAIADLVPEKVKKASAKWPGVEVYKNGFELIEKADVDVIDICLPTYLHAEHAVRAMERGRDVFVEKPVCLNPEEGKKLLETQQRTGRKAMVGQVLRIMNEYAYLKAAKEDGRYGALRSLILKRISPRPDWAWEGWLHDMKRSGSMVLDLHIHDVDFLRWLLGDPQSLRAVGVRNEEGPQQVFTTYQYEDCLVSAEAGWDYPSSLPFEAEYRANFEKATLVFNVNKTPTLTVYNADGTVTVPEFPVDYEASDDSLGGNISSLGAYFSELKYFTECLRDGKPLSLAPLSEGVKAVELIYKELEQL